MLSCRSISLLTTLGAFISAAGAQEACSSLDPLLDTIDTVHEIRLDRPGIVEGDLLTELALGLAAVSLTDIYSHVDGPLPQGQREALTGYVSALRETARQDTPAEALRDQLVFQQDVDPDARREIARLQQHLGCLEAPPAETSSIKEVGAEGSRPVGPLSRKSQGPVARDGRLQALRLDSSYDPSAREVRWDHASLLANWAIPALCLLISLGCLWSWLAPRIRRWRLRDERRTCYIQVPVRYHSRSYSMTILDYTPEGLRLKHDGRIGRRRRISIYLENGWVKGKVAWSNGVHAGIGLFYPLTWEQISYLAGETIADRCETDVCPA